MDKVSAVLIVGILILVVISGAIVYDTWIAPEPAVYVVPIHIKLADEPIYL